jgi:hypothetical protein
MVRGRRLSALLMTFPVHFGRTRTLRVQQTVKSFPGSIQLEGANSLPGPQQQAVTGAGQTVSTRLLFTRRAGVHVDFHAHRHFHDLRSLPTHQGPPKQCWHDVRAGPKTRLTSHLAQARKIRHSRHSDAPEAGNFPLGQSYFALGQGKRTKAADRRMRRFGHLWRIRFVCQSCLSQTDTSEITEHGPKR